MSASKAVALYNFQSSAPVELSLKKGDMVFIRNLDVGDGWCEGELNGQRGLFPISYVKLLEDKDMIDHSPKHKILSNFVTPLTPQTNKKVFIETLLMPTPSTIDRVFDEEKAIELFAANHNDIQISAGPKWNHKPPSLTISVVDCQKQPRSSGMRNHKFYEVRTKELKMMVQRKYKHFLWLYDQLADKFPCVSLPPLPIKQPTETEEGFVEIRRRGLERFINRVARHPVLGSTKILHVFLIATNDKEWRIGTGKHTSIIKPSGSKSSKKLFSAPIYNTVHYPPYNVPINQLAAFDKFSRFSEVLETNLGTMTRSCEVLKTTSGQMGKCFRNLGKDLQSLAKGSSAVSVRHLRKPSQGTTVSYPQPNTHPGPVTLIEKDDIDEEDDDDSELSVGDWNWRDDEKFSKLMSEFYNLGSQMRKLVSQHTEYQDKLEANMVEGLEEYSSIVHTLPVLVKMHEEAMACFNESKHKGSKKDAEHVRQNCETLNNILLSEFDYFSDVMIEELQSMILCLLKEQAEYHKKLACEWEEMYASFYDNRPVRRATVKRSSTLPGYHNKTQANNAVSEVQPRPASSNERPPTDVQAYVNVTSSLPLSQVNGIIDGQLYNNVSTAQKPKSDDVTYENWSFCKSNSSTPTNESPPTVESSIITNKPIPPPLILRRHEVANQSEEDNSNVNTDSFVVPNLHYSQVSVVGPLEDSDIKLHSSESQSTSTGTLTPTSPINKKPAPPPKKNKPLYDKKSSSLFLATVSDTSESFSESSGETDRREVYETQHSSNRELNSIVEEKSNEAKATATSGNSAYSPIMHTKLAKLTQLPPTQTNSLPPRKGPSSSQSLTKLPSDIVTTPTRTLPRNINPTADNNGLELYKKLNERRQKLERQLSGDIKASDDSDIRGSNTSEGVLRWTGNNSEVDLTKFGIVEEGASYIV